MAAPTTDYPGLNTAVTAAVAALEVNDYLTARTKVLEAQLIILYLGQDAQADGSKLQLAGQMVDQLLDNITKLEAYQAAKTSNGRTIRTGLFNGGRRGGLASPGIGSDGVFHD